MNASIKPLTVTMPRMPAITISDGTDVQMYTDSYRASEGSRMPPIRRAAHIARLRALADEIEKAEQA